MVDEEGTEDRVKKEEIKDKIIEGINKIIHKAEGEKNAEDKINQQHITEEQEGEINQYITEEQKAKFEQISKLFLIFIRGNHDYQLTIEDFKELVGKEEILIKPEDGENNLRYEINPEFEKILPDHLKKYFSDKFSPNFINPLIEQLESNKKISDAVIAIKSIDPPQKKEFTEEEKSLIVSALDEKCNGMNLLHILAKDVEVTEDQITALIDKGSRLIHVAVYSGCTGVVKALIDKGKALLFGIKKKSLIEEKDGKGSRPIHVAAYSGCIGMVKALIKEGEDVNKATEGGGATPLCIAAEKGHLKIVQALIEAKADVDKARQGGFTPLFMAAQKGHLEIVQALIDAGANVNKHRKGGATPLFMAAQNGHLEIVQALIEAKADVDKARQGGFTPLYIAAQEGHLEIVQALIKAGANVDQATVDVATQNNHLDIVDALNNKKQPNNICQTSGLIDDVQSVSI
jgi:ankyrin repeat protein